MTRAEPRGEPVRTGFDAETFRSLYPALRRYAAVIADADMDPLDLVQDALVVLLRSPPGHVTDPLLYLRRSMLNATKRKRRRAATRHKAVARIATLPTDMVPSYPSDIEYLLDRLDPIARAVVYLLDVERLPVAQVAETVGKTPLAVKTRASRARRTLQKYLEEQR